MECGDGAAGRNLAVDSYRGAPVAKRVSGDDRGKEGERFVALPVARSGFEAMFARSRMVFDRHTHDPYAFGYISDGGQSWHSGRGQVEGRAGSLIMSNPGEVHDGSPLGDGSRTWCMLHADPRAVHSAAGQLGLAQPELYEFANPAVDDPRLARVMARLFRAATGASPSALLLDELFLFLIGRLGQTRPPESGSGSSRIARARVRIDDDPARAVTLNELARECGLSPWQLLRSFARETGFTPHAYQVQRRIELARRLIARGHALADASVRSGFADQSHMTRTFRRRYGFSPGAWAASTLRRSPQVQIPAIPF